MAVLDHCWHQMMNVYIACGSQEKCCWCGDVRTRCGGIPAGHGPHAPPTEEGQRWVGGDRPCTRGEA